MKHTLMSSSHTHYIIIRQYTPELIAVRLSQIYPREMFLLILGKLKQHIPNHCSDDIDGLYWMLIPSTRLVSIYSFARSEGLQIKVWENPSSSKFSIVG